MRRTHPRGPATGPARLRLCLECQQEADKEQHAVHLYNRKGSKDSQLR